MYLVMFFVPSIHPMIFLIEIHGSFHCYMRYNDLNLSIYGFWRRMNSIDVIDCDITWYVPFKLNIIEYLIYSCVLFNQLLFIYIHSMIKASLLRFLFANFGLNCYCGSRTIIWNSNPIKNSFANCSLNYASSSFIFCLVCVIT